MAFRKLFVSQVFLACVLIGCGSVGLVNRSVESQQQCCSNGSGKYPAPAVDA